MRTTLFIDIDGTILFHIEDFSRIHEYKGSQLILPGAKKKLYDWHCHGYCLVLTTGRPEGLRALTVEQLADAGVLYDQLIMGIGAGPRILINDYVKNTPHKATAINVIRNEGIGSILD